MLDDEKVPHTKNAKPILYVAASENRKAVAKKLEAVRAGMTQKKLPEIDLRTIPKPFTKIKDHEHGLLYLPHPYVVPGGRFNETYGWDSAFIVRGLALSNERELAKSETENKLYSIKHYGTILNANRSYYLGRSQAPFLTQMLLDVHENFPAKKGAKAWLEQALPTAISYYDYWVSPPFLHKKSGLSFYNDLNETPGIEVTFSEPDHYPHALKELQRMKKNVVALRKKNSKLASWTYQQRKDAYYTDLFLSKDGKTLSPLFYRGDRAMRASGFDPSRRFGYFNVDVIHHLPVCLNTLLYIMERDFARIHRLLKDSKGAKLWTTRAAKRKKQINTWLWDKDGYRDRHFNDALNAKYHLPAHRDYRFATAFYPLWAGIATKAQAASVVKHILPKLMTENGLMTSDRETGSQWDAPFAWAPLQVIAIRGLMAYGYEKQARALALGFVNTVNRGFEATGLIFEKYDMESGTHKTGHKIDKGYNTNVEGFGWTNAAVLECLALLRTPTAKNA